MVKVIFTWQLISDRTITFFGVSVSTGDFSTTLPRSDAYTLHQANVFNATYQKSSQIAHAQWQRSLFLIL